MSRLMDLYYEDESVTLFHGDCLDLRAWLTADVLVTDPPYGMAYEGGFARNRATKPRRDRQPMNGDSDQGVRDSALRLWGEKPALVFGRWNVPRPENTRARLIWDKTPCGFMGDLALPWGSAEEEIYVLGSGFVGKREANVLRAQTLMSGDARRPNHPTPKPVALMESLIAKCPPGVISDPFSGSGATLIAARNLGRKAIGVEIEEKYCELIVSRLSQQAFVFEEI